MKLTERINRDFSLAGFSERTKVSYFGAIKRCKAYFQKPLNTLTKEELKNYLSYLINNKASEATIKHAYSALKFLFTVTFESSWPLENVPIVKLPKKLPVVLDISEVTAILSAAKNLKHKAIFSVTYSGGLRLSETVNLKIGDIDSKRMLIRVRQGKGKKDRYTLLSKITLNHLRDYYRKYHPRDWLFTGVKNDEPISIRTLQNVFDNARQKAGILKEATFHTLRHSFATHLYEAGVGLVHIQRLLGHTCIKTTMVYIHLAKKEAANIKSPLDCVSEA
jgi:site-specific recombinase XerD